MTETPQSQPAGWYPDPEVPSSSRYWDGSAWTEHRAPTGTVPGPPARESKGRQILMAFLLVAILVFLYWFFKTGG